MRIKKTSDGYTLWLSASDTYNWAHKPGACWPCSMLADKRLRVSVDSNGIYDLQIDGRDGDCPADELQAVIADHLPADCRKYWPVWA